MLAQIFPAKPNNWSRRCWVLRVVRVKFCGGIYRNLLGIINSSSSSSIDRTSVVLVNRAVMNRRGFWSFRKSDPWDFNGAVLLRVVLDKGPINWERIKRPSSFRVGLFRMADYLCVQFYFGCKKNPAVLQPRSCTWHSALTCAIMSAGADDHLR